MTAAGTVNARREAIVRLRLRSPAGVELDVDLIVDTAFSGWLALPADLCAHLQLPKRTTGNARLGDGSARGFDVFAAEVRWAGGWRSVSAAAIGRDALIGMRMLSDHRLTIDVTPGGSVLVVPLAK